MNHTAKIFMNGQSQAVRLPKEYRFKSDIVYVRKNAKGEVILSEQPRTWADYFNENSSSLGFENLMIDREQDTPVERDIF
ncbi:AbrB/MazE/SpoVT family DNA-binding domain-containing protein [Acinetobacter sp. 3657]|uniref:antitoxin n=1 Tax=Acinetobacter sp. 3657 TaxID=2817764 RepID=UPI00285E11E9|nr:antitoxin VapB [Prolinoborus sp. 3657]